MDSTSFIIDSIVNKIKFHLLNSADIESAGPVIYLLRQEVDNITNSIVISDKTLTILRSLVELFWEQLHAVYYQNVTRSTRIGYCFSTVLLSIALSRKRNNIRESIKWLDYALIMVDAPLIKSEIIQLVEMLQNLEISSVNDKPFHLTSIDHLSHQRLADIRFPVQTYSGDISLTKFRELANKGNPFVLEGAVKRWDCVREWARIETLVETMGLDRIVPVEIGSQYTESDWTQKLLSVREFTNNYLMGKREEKGYLAQHDLFDQMPFLRTKFTIPDYCYVTFGDKEFNPNVLINAWIGPAGTVSPLHTDPHDNLFAQVVGRKYLRLYSPAMSEYLYSNDADHMTSNTSRVDIENLDCERFPLFEQAEYVETIVNAGDLLFIPKGWWHFVKSLDISVSISFWF